MTTKLQMRASVTSVAFMVVLQFATFAQDKRGQVCQETQDGQLKKVACNGISVGTPKEFDNRTLTLMVESLSQTLLAQQQSYIDQKTVAGALSNVQGFNQTETSTNLSVTGTPTPATDVKTTLNTGNVNAAGNPLPNTFQRQTDVSRGSVTPQAPALDTSLAFQGFNPTYGSSAFDLLNDQVNLTYQIFNLRMILERSLSDRLLPNETGDNKTRLQAVLGFNVTIDPPRTANEAVAVVEITLTSHDNKDLSLVSLMPQEKTYNAAALSNKSNAFAGSAAVSAVQIGLSARKRTQIFYLYRDNDTLSYERMTGDPKTIVFGWMFRPVLGRRSVSPGLRQLFAIMALPNVDCTKVDSACKASLTATVRTYWKKYDPSTLSSFKNDEANRARLFWYGLSLGLAKPQIFEELKYENDATYNGVDVLASADYQDALKPTVGKVTWHSTGAKNILISARGNNFFSQTKVALGDKTYSEGTGLTLKSNQAFDLTTTLDALANGPGTIIGRYDIGVPLTNTDVPDSLKNGVEVRDAFLGPSLAGIRKIEIHLQKKASEQQLVEIKTLQNTESSALRQLKAAKALATAEDQAQMAKSEAERFAAQNRLDAAQDLFKTTGATTSDIAALESQVSSARTAFERKYHEVHTLHAQDLPREQLTKSLTAPETPVISVNGTPIDLPYEISNASDGGIQHVIIQADVKDSLIGESGGGIVKVSWPFYPQDEWTPTYRFYNPDAAFEVTRVSQKTIIIHRIDGRSFINGPETDTGTCWNLIVGDEELPLTRACPPKPTPGPDPGKPASTQKDKTKNTPVALPPPSDYVVTATVETLPDKVVLVAPSGSIYNLSVPPLKAKEDKTGPIELKQYDSQWIEIKSADLTIGPSPASAAAPDSGAKNPGPDLSKVTSVEANGKPLNYVKQEDKAASTDDKDKKAPSIKSIKVEIIRDLTSKPGTVDIAFHGAGNELLGTRQLHITQTDWGSKGDK